MTDASKVTNQVPDRFKDAPEVARGKLVEWIMPGQVVVGTYLRSKTMPSKKKEGQTYSIFELVDENGELFVVSGGAILSDQMQQVPPQSEVCITFVEKLAGSGAFDFRVKYIAPKDGK
jgi:hypothetical protein